MQIIIGITMNKKAVIFDLFETLVDFSLDQYSAVIASMARRIGKDPHQLVPAWHANWAKREIGAFDDVADYIVVLAGPIESESDLSAAAAMHWAYEKQLLIPHANTISMLKCLKDKGYKIGVITNCPMETPTLWPESPLSILPGQTGILARRMHLCRRRRQSGTACLIRPRHVHHQGW
jgi:putative hydrolase of the HAD superfamily